MKNREKSAEFRLLHRFDHFGLNDWVEIDREEEKSDRI
jgi:hypothetical protein